MLVGPVLVALGMSEFFTEILENDSEIDDAIIDNLPLIKSVIDLFTMFKWVQNKRFTQEGNFFLNRAVFYQWVR